MNYQEYISTNIKEYRDIINPYHCHIDEIHVEHGISLMINNKSHSSPVLIKNNDIYFIRESTISNFFENDRRIFNIRNILC